ncbi:Alpha-mannosidase I MNS5 [Fasciola gigantica]|uniref:alpha-1,2-Mannosidase n=1 Tax=Fasciola gigantica TaxID=46835 RepID=A0A504YY49_FASGI|nr:Alpha-mannosidase I MNS5 [Fasciola gigantica]
MRLPSAYPRLVSRDVIVYLLFLHICASNQWWIKHPSESISTNFDSAAQQSIYRLLDFLRVSFPTHLRNDTLNRVREMFDFAYGSYTTYAFPFDELNPIDCTGRGYDHKNPDNINVNDALGDYHLTLIDTLDTLAIMGKSDDFTRAVELLLRHLSFNRDNRVQLFEATIRVVGGLLSAHMLITDPAQTFGDLRPESYNDELLTHAHDLANRMLDAFESSPTGLPYPRFYLGSGRKDNTTTEACLAGAGSLLLEFGCLSAILGDPSYANIARRVVLNLWNRRSGVTGLLGSTIDVNSGKWINRMSGLGAGQDSFYEYLHKTAVLFDDAQIGLMFNEAFATMRYHLRSSKNASSCLGADGIPSVYWNLDMYTGDRMNYWVDSLQSVWPGIFAHHGEIRDAICQHAIHFFIWQLYGLPPERYDIVTEQPQLSFYPLRPEFIESTYFLYRVTKHPFYLRVGEQIINNLDKYARAKCGFATIHSVEDKSKEDRMESFFLSETLKYLYLLFDENNPLNRNEMDYMFSTQAHIFPIKRIRQLIKKFPTNPFQSIKNPPISSSDRTLKTCPSPRVTYSSLPLDREEWKKIGAFIHAKFKS